MVFDDQAWRTSIDGTGVDRRGGSRGQVSVVCNITAQPDGTHVSVDAELLLSGAVAQFGWTGLINEISAQLIGDFVGCLEAKLRAEPAVAATIAAAPPKGFTLLVRICWRGRRTSSADRKASLQQAHDDDHRNTVSGHAGNATHDRRSTDARPKTHMLVAVRRPSVKRAGGLEPLPRRPARNNENHLRVSPAGQQRGPRRLSASSTILCEVTSSLRYRAEMPRDAVKRRRRPAGEGNRARLVPAARRLGAVAVRHIGAAAFAPCRQVASGGTWHG